MQAMQFFGVQCKSNGEPLKNFKQMNAMLQFITLYGSQVN